MTRGEPVPAVDWIRLYKEAERDFNQTDDKR
jgi:hypothetical protein